MGLKNEFETTVLNESSVIEPLKVYCTMYVYINVKMLQNYLRLLKDPITDTIINAF